jgi:glycosyltransferase involved in cell wall biosynthesis
MRVLFASGIDGFCHRYAVLHWAEQLATQAIGATVRAHVDPRVRTELAGHDLLVLYRVPMSPWIAEVIDAAHAAAIPTLFAVDDLIVDPRLPAPTLLRGRDERERRLWHEGVARYRATLEACDAVLGTTPALVACARAAGKPAHLHRCGLGRREIACAARAPRRRDGGVRLGYFSGTPTHDADFALIAPVLLELLDARTDLTLVVGGTLTLDPTFARFGARVQREPWVPWPALPALLAGVDVCLAPLDLQDPFTAAKGAIKYLEAAAVGVPTVASPAESFRDAIDDGRTGVLAADTPAWRRTLTALIDDRAHAARLGAAARTDAGRRFGPAEQGRALAAIVRTAAAARGGASHPPAHGAAPTELAAARAHPGEVARAAREPDAWPDLLPAALAEPTPPLGDGTVLAQRFPARLRGLTRVDVHGITYGQRLDHELALRVRRDDGVAIAAERCPAALVPDRDWLALEFPPQGDSAGRRYTLELEARGTGPGNALSFGTTAVADGGEPLTWAGTRTTHALALRTFAAGEIA